jgi:hypothetical protein
MRPFGWLLLSCVHVAGCRQNDEPEEAEDLLASVEGYREWARAPGFEERRPSQAAHGEAVEIFISAEVVDAFAALPGELAQWPTGSVIVKEGFDGAGEKQLTAIMEKRQSGWFWAEYDSQGEVLYSGAPKICTDCHATGSDFVRAFALP